MLPRRGARRVGHSPAASGQKELLAGLKKLGVRGLTKAPTSDELDAATAALVGQWVLSGRGEMLGGEDGICIPSGRFLGKAKRNRSLFGCGGIGGIGWPRRGP